MAGPSNGKRIVVVGAGPVGLTVALDLARRGLRPLLLDVKQGLSPSSRAVCVSRRSLEIFRRLGMTPGFFDKALPWARGKTFHRDRLVFELEMATAPGEDCFSPFVNIQLAYTEGYLLETLRALGDDAAELRWGHRVLGVTQDADGVTIQVDGPDGAYRCECDWLVAADGGRSPIRTALGCDLKGTSYEGRYLIADISVDGAALPVERYVWFDPISNPGSTVIVHVQPDGVWRIDLQIDGKARDAEVLAEANLLPRIQAHLDMMGVPGQWRLLWKSVYRAHALSMDDYRVSRVLFAGDAAHLVPIFGVRGLNSGIDDAHNLSWKLALVVGGAADPRLLDSYTQERRTAALENLAQATKSTWFMSPPTPGFEVMRNAALALAEDQPWARALINPRQSSAHTYRASSVVRYDAPVAAPGVEPGAVVPSLRLGPNAYLHDVLAQDRCTLLIFGAALGSPSLARAIAMARAEGLEPLVVGSEPPADDVSVAAIGDPEGAIAARFAAPSFPLYLVRPDAHVAARLSRVAEDTLRTVVRQALGLASHATPASAFLPVLDAGQLVPPTPLEAVFETLARTAADVDSSGRGVALGAAALVLANALIALGGDPQAALATAPADAGPAERPASRSA